MLLCDQTKNALGQQDAVDNDTRKDRKTERKTEGRKRGRVVVEKNPELIC